MRGDMGRPPPPQPMSTSDPVDIDPLNIMDKLNGRPSAGRDRALLELSDPQPFRAAGVREGGPGGGAARRRPGESLVASGAIYRSRRESARGRARSSRSWLRTGSSPYLEELRSRYPPGIFDLLRIPHLGLKKIGVLYSELGIASLDALEEAARDGRLGSLKGFGPKTAEQLLEGIAFARMRESKFLLPGRNRDRRDRCVSDSRRSDDVDDVEVSGSVRRRLEIIRNVNLVISTKKAAKVAARLGEIVTGVEQVDATTYKGVARGEMNVLVHFASPADLGSELFRTTGSEEFVARVREVRQGRERARGVHEGRHSVRRAGTARDRGRFAGEETPEARSCTPTSAARFTSTRRSPTAATRCWKCSPPRGTADGSTWASPIIRRPPRTPAD